MEAFIYVALVSEQLKSKKLPLSCDTILLSEAIKGSIRLAMSYYVNVYVYDVKRGNQTISFTICLFFRLQLISVNDWETSPVVLLITFGLYYSRQGNGDVRKLIVDLASFKYLNCLYKI